MNNVISRLTIVLLLTASFGSAAIAQQAAIQDRMAKNDLAPLGSRHSESYSDPVFSATGQSYWGFDLGLTYSWYLGGQHFFWPVVDVANNIWTPFQFDNLGSGLGGVFGVKAALPLSHSIDLEGKLRYLTNYTSATETHNLFVSNTGGQAPATSTYSLLMNNLDFAAILHFALSDEWYAAGGLSFSGLLGNRFSASQSPAPGFTYNDLNGNPTFVPGESVLPVSRTDLVGSRADLQLGAGTVFPLSSNSFAIDAELLLSVPLTAWLQSGDQIVFNNFADTYNAAIEAQGGTAVLSYPTFPKLWYASLTIGIRFPFGKAEEQPTAYSSSEVPGTQQGIGPDGKVALTGSVRDSKTGRPVDATMTVVDLTNNQVVATDHTDDNGRYSIRVKAPGKYSVTADADGYLFGTAYFQVDDQGRILANHADIKLSETKGGRTRLLVFFNTASAELNASSYPELDRAVRLMKAVPTMSVEIAGYTDSVGSGAYNLDLSQRRANAVRKYLIDHGIQKSRVTAHGYGKESPIADNGTDAGRAENRRVEFVVTSN
ncbi:MAG TPA: OmpA family protein [Candidatus Kapabacteria bacterium]|nr:OmpA family protein [Candidatus Kapabacteria bacterium]